MAAANGLSNFRSVRASRPPRGFVHKAGRPSEVPSAVSYDPNPHAPTAGPHPAGGWIRPLHPGGCHGDGPGDDGLVHLAGLILTALAVLTLATGAALIGLAAYGLVTWRRTRWWPSVLLGLAAGLVAIGILGGPAGALHHHLTALRELAGPHPDGLGALIAQRLPVWLFWQLPLGAPLGLIGAGLARHRVTHQAAHDLSPSAQARRRAEQAAAQSCRIPLTSEGSRPDREEASGERGHATVAAVWAIEDGPEEFSFVEARLAPATGAYKSCDADVSGELGGDAPISGFEVEQ